jgi:hypothetical protein
MKKKIMAMTALAAVGGYVQITNAVVSPPATTGLYIYDTATGDSQYVAISGSETASYDGTVGDYSVNVNLTGNTAARGGAPIIDLDIADVQAGAGATTLQVFYSDGAFGPTTGNFLLAGTGVGAGSTGSATTSAYLGASVFGTSTLLGTVADPGSVTGSINSSSYYLTLDTTITGSIISQDSNIAVSSAVSAPDGGTTVALLGLGMTSLGMMRKFRGPNFPSLS